MLCQNLSRLRNIIKWQHKEITDQVKTFVMKKSAIFVRISNILYCVKNYINQTPKLASCQLSWWLFPRGQRTQRLV